MPISQAREKGFRQALNGKNIAATYLYTDNFHKNHAATAFSRWLDQNELPTSIFTTSFTLLEGVLLVLLQRQGHIPPQLMIATFGHFEMLELLENAVICSVQDYDKISRSLLNLALNALSKKHKNTANTTPLMRKLVKYHC